MKNHVLEGKICNNIKLRVNLLFQYRPHNKLILLEKVYFYYNLHLKISLQTTSLVSGIQIMACQICTFRSIQKYLKAFHM